MLWFEPAVVDHDSVAYLIARAAEPGMSELGAAAFGPHADTLATTLTDQIRHWNRDQRHGPGPTITVWPNNAAAEALAPTKVVSTKHHTRITISWP